MTNKCLPAILLVPASAFRSGRMQSKSKLDQSFEMVPLAAKGNAKYKGLCSVFDPFPG